jgi:tetratricopeptide (TPR) repeat protein
MKQYDAKSSLVASYGRDGRCVEAISVMEELVQSQPANPELHHQLGMCYSGACTSHALVSIRVAVSYFERALSLIGPAGPFPLRAKYLDSLGNACLQDGRPEAALVYLSEAAAPFNRGRAYTRQAELDPGVGFDEAVRCFRQAEKCFLVCRDSEQAAAARAELARLDIALRQKHI